MSSPEVSGLPSQMGFLTYHCQRLTFEVAAFFCFFHVHIQIQRVSWLSHNDESAFQSRCVRGIGKLDFMVMGLKITCIAHLSGISSWEDGTSVRLDL